MRSPNRMARRPAAQRQPAPGAARRYQAAGAPGPKVIRRTGPEEVGDTGVNDSIVDVRQQRRDHAGTISANLARIGIRDSSG